MEGGTLQSTTYPSSILIITILCCDFLCGLIEGLHVPFDVLGDVCVADHS